MWTIVDVRELVQLRHLEKMVRYCNTEMNGKKPKPQDFTLLPKFATSCDSQELVLLRQLKQINKDYQAHTDDMITIEKKEKAVLNQLTEVRNGFRA